MTKDKFLWGSATSAYQCEGGWNADDKGISNWDDFCHSEKNNINCVTGDVASDFYHRYEEDIKLLSQGGQNAYRFSLAWTRIIPDGKTNVSQAGIDFYDCVIDTCEKYNVEPFVTLYHYDMPIEYFKNGGWENRETFEALVPVTIMILLTGMLSVAILNLTGTTLPSIVLTIISPLIKFVDNVFGVSLIAVLQQVLWWFGIHDTAIGAVISPIRDANIAMNSAAYAAGTAVADLPYTFTAPFWWVFCQIGGSGCTLGLAVLLLKSKSKQLKTVGKLGIIPALFNINEPILFGIPIILNPLWLVPFVLVQVFNAATTYIVMDLGIIAKTFIEPGWNMFAPIGAFLSTLDVKAVIFIIILTIIDTLIYYPFFKAQEKQCLAEEEE